MISSVAFVLLALSLVCAAQFSPPTGKGPIDTIPAIGIGTWALRRNTSEVIAMAIQNGFRHIDAAWIYNNQRDVGLGIKEGLRRTGMKREDIWVTSKLWNDRHADKVSQGLEETLQQLGLDYLDLWLVHFPVGQTTSPSRFDHVETWKSMEKLLTATPRRTRFIGISNFSPKQLKETMTAASVTPYMHQFEMHPYLQQTDFIAANKAYNISLTGYAPLGNTNAPYRASSLYSPSEPPPLLQNSVITEIATARNCTPAQVVLAWNLARGVTVIPKAAQPGHQAENLATWTRCTLGEGDAEKVAKMQDRWVRRVNNPCLQMRMPCFEGLAGGPPAT